MAIVHKAAFRCPILQSIDQQHRLVVRAEPDANHWGAPNGLPCKFIFFKAPAQRGFMRSFAADAERSVLQCHKRVRLGKKYRQDKQTDSDRPEKKYLPEPGKTYLPAKQE